MWPETRISHKLGIHFPIIQAPMAGGATTPELVAAVSNAGGLGSLGAGYMKAGAIKKAINEIRRLTSQPFAVNLFISEPHEATTTQIQNACRAVELNCSELNIKIDAVSGPFSHSFAEQMQVILEEKVPVFSFTFGTLEAAWIEKLKQNQTVLIGTATNLAEALILESDGIDILVAQGSEAGGHRGTFLGTAENSLIGLCSLLPQIVDSVKIPVLAAGGIMDGRGINAALAFGAEGVQMGTAFLTCVECGVHPIYKNALLNKEADNTVLTRAFSGKLARGLRNQFIERMSVHGIDILDYPIQNAITRVMRKESESQKNIEFMSIWAGQSTPLCREVPAAQLMAELIDEVRIIAKK